MLALIRGAGDLATGIALRLWRSGIRVVLTDLERPTAIRRTVAFSEAIVYGETTVEDVTARPAANADEARALLAQGIVPVLADPGCACREALAPDALVDAILAKRNLGTRITETMRGHTLGRVIYSGSAIPNTNVPGLIGGFAGERVLRAPADGAFRSVHRIGDLVKAGDIAGYVSGEPMVCTIDGVLRGLIADGIPVRKGMKSGDVDPRGDVEKCYTVSDKAPAVGGGVLEAILHLSGALLED